MHRTTNVAWNIAKGVLRYLKGTVNFGITYRKGGLRSIIGYSDADWATELPEQKSISGFAFTYSGGAISWKRKKQSVVAQNTLDAEYIALSEAIREALWFKKFSAALECIPNYVFNITLDEDNQGCISGATDNFVNSRSKHIDVRYQMVVYWERRGMFTIRYVPTNEMVADIMTRRLSKETFNYLVRKLDIS